METVETGTTEPRSPGAILAAERERQGLARADIAQRLHMSVTQIEALEQADYSRLPSGMFLRGFTRNYARLLGLDSQVLVGMLIEDAPRDTAPRIVVPSQNIRFDPLGERFSGPYVRAAAVAGVFLVLGFAALYWWFYVWPGTAATTTAVRKPAVQAVKPPAPEHSPQVPSEPPKSEPAPEMRAPETAPPPPEAKPVEPVKEAPKPAMTEAPAAPATMPAAVAADDALHSIPGGALLRLRFKGEAWVEIKDARGRVLVSRTHSRGSDAEVAGKPPFNVVIGNAPGVTLLYNDREVDLGPHTRVAVARLTVP